MLLILLSFSLMHAVPGGPFDSEQELLPEIKANIEKKYHLDQSAIVQLGYYVVDLLKGDLGPSFKYRDWTVNQLIQLGFPVSATLGCYAMLFAFLVGSALGAVAAFRQNTGLDYGVMALAMLGISVPTFVTAPLFILIFAVGLHWLPAGDWAGGDWRHLLLPVVALALPQMAYIARIMRGSLVETLKSSFIRTARAKGLGGWRIFFKHALRPALLPVLSYLGPATASLLTGSVVIEQVFGLPGIGRHFVQGALNRDYTLVMGVVIVSGVLIIAFNLIADILYAVIDPKLRHDRMA